MFSGSKISNMGSAVLEGGPSANIHKFCFQAAKRSDMDCVKVQGVYLLIVRKASFMLRNVQIRAVPSCKRVDLLMFRNSGFRVRNVEIRAVLSSNEDDLMMLMNQVFMPRSDQKCAVYS